MFIVGMDIKYDEYKIYTKQKKYGRYELKQQ